MKKLRLYLHELLDDPAIHYPAWYLLSPKLHRDENLREALRALHRLDFTGYAHPGELSEIFTAFRTGQYPIYRERFVTGYFGGRVMLLESSGWKTLPFSEESVNPENWLI